MLTVIICHSLSTSLSAARSAPIDNLPHDEENFFFFCLTESRRAKLLRCTRAYLYAFGHSMGGVGGGGIIGLCFHFLFFPPHAVSDKKCRQDTSVSARPFQRRTMMAVCFCLWVCDIFECYTARSPESVATDFLWYTPTSSMPDVRVLPHRYACSQVLLLLHITCPASMNC